MDFIAIDALQAVAGLCVGFAILEGTMARIIAILNDPAKLT